jgi:NAD(P)-dependent dehydrogenase (short-subunit alcohol dehydrogenase family)/acyl-CoA thioesterase FadM/phosphopantetheinyl transferase
LQPKLTSIIYIVEENEQAIINPFAATLSLENDNIQIRVCSFANMDAFEFAANSILLEITTKAKFSSVRYDDKGVRWERQLAFSDPSAYQKRKIKWSKNDVILVTGGAKGITAECAFAFANKNKVKMALVGSSPLTNGGEIEATINRYKDANLICSYYQCSVTQPLEDIKELKAKIENEMGEIRGIIHGAGLNKPSRIEAVDLEFALKEIKPKVTGAQNLCDAFSNGSLKLFAGFTSIIGVSGMMGNSVYGYSNALSKSIITKYGQEHPKTEVVAMAFSIWDSIGMGAHSGSIEYLANFGIAAIPVKAGVNKFLQLTEYDPGTEQIIVTAAMGHMFNDTMQIEANKKPKAARYLEKVISFVPHVELIVQASLTLEKDVYVKDHNWRGSYLFPTVFGLEAMAQAVAYVANKHDFSAVKIKDIILERPIVVDPEFGADIQINAIVEEDESVRVSISTSATNYEIPHFSAIFSFNDRSEDIKLDINIPDEPLDIDVKRDLYGWLLFQGPLYQRLLNIFMLTDRKCIFTTQTHKKEEMILGDPFFRDSLLQSTQIIVSPDICLPVHIECIEKFSDPEQDLITGVTTVDSKSDLEIIGTITAVNDKGSVIEKLTGYKTRILEHQIEFPNPEEIIEPNKIDGEKMKAKLEALNVELPTVSITHIPGIANLKKNDRKVKESPIYKETVKKALKKQNIEITQEPQIRWTSSGKPYVQNYKNIDISASDDGQSLLCVAGVGKQGCDLQTIEQKTREDWIIMLTADHQQSLDELIRNGDSLDQAGTRIWAAKETAFKALGTFDFNISIETKQNSYTTFKCGDLSVLTFKIKLARKAERIAAIVVNSSIPEDKVIPTDYSGYKDLVDMHHMEIMEGGPQGQGFFVQRIPVTFRPNSQLSRTIYFPNYFFWLGEIREAAMWPVLEKVARQFSTGKWGIITNNSCINILGEATARDKIEICMWASGNSGPANSTMDLTIDFRKILKDGSYERLAWCEQQVTWVQILDHGIVKPEPYPDYYWDLMKNLVPRYEAPNVPEPLPEPLTDLKRAEGDKNEYRAPSGPIVRPLLHEQTIETSLYNSNIVGNIYFANYYAWQGQTRDQYFFNLIPEYYRGTGEKGELLCLECRVDHLREAMPFDRIVVTMALKALKTYSVVLYFEYFRLESDGTRVKLAFGEHHAVWVVRDSQGKPAPAPFPSKVQEAFRQAIAERQ